MIDECKKTGDPAVGSTRLVGTLSPMRMAMRAWAKQWREDRVRFGDIPAEVDIERAKYWRDEALKSESQQAAIMSPNTKVSSGGQKERL